MSNDKMITNKMKSLRKECLEISHLGNDGNLQSTFSALDILYVLYNDILTTTDTFVLSKGQASLGLYVVLADKGFLNKDELKTFCKFDSKFGMQIDRTKFDDVSFTSTGSLWHGLPIAVGIAMANKLLDNTDMVYCLIGDGELQEGTMWESIQLACHHQLNNLTIIIDNNKSTNSMISIPDLSEILEYFGCFVTNANGHSHDCIYNAFDTLSMYNPFVLIADTKRGYGSKTLMTDRSWFHKAPNKEELELLKNEVDIF